MLAGSQSPPAQLDMGRRRGQQQQGFDTLIAKHAVDIGRGGKGKGLGEMPAALRRTAAGPDHLGPVREIDQAFRMGADRHAEAEDGEAALHLRPTSPFRGRRHGVTLQYCRTSLAEVSRLD